LLVEDCRGGAAGCDEGDGPRRLAEDYVSAQALHVCGTWGGRFVRVERFALYSFAVLPFCNFAFGPF